jgi:hypothetical protein
VGAVKQAERSPSPVHTDLSDHRAVDCQHAAGGSVGTDE